MIFPAELGDALWAVAVYLGYRLILMSTSRRTTAILALVTSFVVEWSQLLTWDWLLAIRQTTLGHLFLGQGFRFWDLVAYAVGILAIFLIDDRLLKKE
ncbi:MULTISPECIES: DUF2809 domain-containing protein [unclassified Streptococcus]|uniref:ribosomal maturation YjgA family protein n=1 Tax=unclassified Streptococcus TaxID=2608887 RepID=UPI00359DFEC0